MSILSLEANFVLKVWCILFIIGRYGSFFWGVKMVGVLVFTWFVGVLEVEQEQSKI